MSYKKLEIWQLARELTIDIHKMTLEDLPGVERFEEGQQLRRSIKSVRSNIVEGYGRRRYKREFIRFLTYSLASNDESADHLDMLHESGSLTDQQLYDELKARLEILGRKLNYFLQAVERKHISAQETKPEYTQPNA